MRAECDVVESCGVDKEEQCEGYKGRFVGFLGEEICICLDC